MADKKAIGFGIGLLIFGLFALLLPFSPAFQDMKLPETADKYINALQTSGGIAIPLSFVLFYLAYKNKVF